MEKIITLDKTNIDKEHICCAFSDKKCSEHFAVTCETKEEDRNNKYGYAQVLKKASDLSNQYVKNATAFSTSLVNFGDKSWSPKLSEKIKITEENFKGVLKSRVEDFAMKIKSN